jgi:hypothetical protein
VLSSSLQLLFSNAVKKLLNSYSLTINHELSIVQQLSLCEQYTSSLVRSILMIIHQVWMKHDILRRTLHVLY